MFSNKGVILIIFFLFTFTIFGIAVNRNFAYAETLKAPTITQASEDNKNTFKPIINGVTESNTLVKIYIDGIYNGKTDFLTSDFGTANFTYQSFVDLKPGFHSVWAIAEDREGNKSQPSNILNFEVRAGVPTPTLFTPIVNSDTNYDQPFIVGLSKNNLVVKIFIDDTPSGEVQISGNTDTVSFYYKPAKPLAIGAHTVYSIAIDNDGRESKKSDIVNFKVSSPALIQEEGSNNEEIKPLEQDEQNEEANAVPPAQESKLKFSRNLISVIIIIIFVAGWIVWTKRQFIKEKVKSFRVKK